ncbi:MAG TPA: hypothetical protein VMV10_09555 [Pirellulales bacterium]|nr:hypothetical protein [Pirellulales bacterium]
MLREQPPAAPSIPNAAAVRASQGDGLSKTGAPSGPIQQPEAAIRGTDRRAVVRLRFPHKQFVAPYHGDCIPSRASFKEVVCRDISEQGFSFLATCPPDFEMLVVALGVAPNLTYMTARIANRVRVSDGPIPLYRIGCRFTGRLS